jgi:hypothetical protein
MLRAMNMLDVDAMRATAGDGGRGGAPPFDTDAGNVVDVMRNRRGPSTDGGPSASVVRVLLSALAARGPRDHAYRGYQVRENPRLQLQGKRVRPAQCPL